MATLATIHPDTLDLSRRSTESEWLDDAELHPKELERVLRDLARFNGTMLGRWAIISWLRRAMRNVPDGKPLTVVDVGCGYGDLLRSIRRWSRPGGLPLNLIGLDVSQETIRIAQAATDKADQIDYQAESVFDFRPAVPIDVVVSSLLTHHLSDRLIVEFLRWMEGTARKGWLIYDLQRHPLPYHFIGVAGAVLRLHPMVVHDGRISVARSLTRSEWRTRLAVAGIPRDAVELRWFLYRFVIGRMR
jgi:2-polyprenyl-3-methyl-5-hydroxy-6-metoxy-1,4-benzoquinol methylase